MKDSLITRLRDREVVSPGVRTQSSRKLYGSRALIDELDIVNELDGHTGCVNALSWSKSGNLLASGSDDQHLNIHTYQPSTSNVQFKLTTTVATGHTQNIFSVKFMPGNGDRKVITAAGDGEVRVFDLEYAGQAREASRSSAMSLEGRRSGRNAFYSGVRYLGDGDTDSRVYRSHSDRVKRLVTESSPHLFLSCSEDGEVRQWDLRQPSSAYPAPRGGRRGSGEDSGVPPPLISYKRYNLDLNTISCSASQPHYIALGGAHLHCFLHDRRMTGRDRLREAGKTFSPARSSHSDEEEAMNQATRCVRKFAPRGQQKMNRTENGHITACKISDARPDEMVVSWSGDHIYSFDLVRSPDAGEGTAEKTSQLPSESRRAKESRDRKRKRKAAESESSLGVQESAARGTSRPRSGQVGEGAALRVRYQNGQSEDIPISQTAIRSTTSGLTDQQRDAQRIARDTVRIRASLFAPVGDSTDKQSTFTIALGDAASIMLDLDETMREWRYPMAPLPEQILVEQTLRRNRESARRFVQASGTLARVLGGQLRTGSSGSSLLLSHFIGIEPRSNDLPLSTREHFGYDFVKAILLFLESGVGRLIEGFTRPAEMSPTVKAAQRLPIPEDEATLEAIDDILIPYLLRLASDRPIVNLEANRFETDDSRQLFSSEKTAVMAFQAALRIPFADLSSAVIMAEGEGSIQAQDRETARKFWGMKVARGVLLNAAEGLDYICVDRAFGGVGRVVREVQEAEERLGGTAEEQDAVQNVEMLDAEGVQMDGATAEDLAAAGRAAREVVRSGASADAEGADDTAGLLEEADEDHLRQTILEAAENHDQDDDDDLDDDDDYFDMDDSTDYHSLPTNPEEEDLSDSSEPSELDGVLNLHHLPHSLFSSAFERRRHKERVEQHVPCSASTRTYRGHCNVRTVKDVNFFGLDEEYVVSGSDDGNLFIWDRKTSELVNVLEGDGEVVNVVQGHPQETMLAVSGIDSTIKIFSPDGRARAEARRGEGVRAGDASQFSSIAYPHRLGRRVQRQRQGVNSELVPVTSEPAFAARGPLDLMDEEDEEAVAPNGLRSRRKMHDAYRIMNKNDVERQGGNQDAYITVRDLHPLLLLLGRGGDLGLEGY